MFSLGMCTSSGGGSELHLPSLNVNPSAIPRKQPPQCSSKDHSNAVKDEVMKLKRVGAIKEVLYLEWLANTVIVKKKNEKWLVCVDFTDLNKACLKDITL